MSVLRSAVVAAAAATENLLPGSAAIDMVAAREHLVKVEGDFVTCTQ
jgi:hypothetical protein